MKQLTETQKRHLDELLRRRPSRYDLGVLAAYRFATTDPAEIALIDDAAFEGRQP